VSAPNIFITASSDNIVFENATMIGGGPSRDIIQIQQSTNVVFRNSEFRNNENMSWGLFNIFDFSDVKFENSIISGNTGTGNLLNVTNDANAIISNTIISDNTFVYAIAFSTTSTVTLENVEFENNNFSAYEFTELGDSVG